MSGANLYIFLSMVVVCIIVIVKGAALPNKQPYQRKIYNLFGFISLFMVLLLTLLAYKGL